ncbi:helix-turn-helix domain-containing protein [Sphingobium sp. Z007]|uniref:helix-turn-helix domain-containing protein n=1 Tax=Sphingobium sp. Z007 TaxID=627495 RepID=UPI0020CD08FE|nr:LysR family transcriptional regulator [Sphingobium sp. Z007]
MTLDPPMAFGARSATLDVILGKALDRWQAMTVFVRVAEADGFAQSAIAALEDQIGVRLLTRTAWSVKLSEGGRGYGSALFGDIYPLPILLD